MAEVATKQAVNDEVTTAVDNEKQVGEDVDELGRAAGEEEVLLVVVDGLPDAQEHVGQAAGDEDDDDDDEELCRLAVAVRGVGGVGVVSRCLLIVDTAAVKTAPVLEL